MWCNGSTRALGARRSGSNPDTPTLMEKFKFPPFFDKKKIINKVVDRIEQELVNSNSPSEFVQNFDEFGERLLKEIIEEEVENYYQEKWGSLQDDDEKMLELSDAYKGDFHSWENREIEKDKDIKKSFDIEKIIADLKEDIITELEKRRYRKI